MEHSRFYLAVSTLTVIILWSLFVLTFMEAFFLLGCWTKLLFPAITQSLVVALHVDLKAILDVFDFAMLTSSFSVLNELLHAVVEERLLCLLQECLVYCFQLLVAQK